MTDRFYFLSNILSLKKQQKFTLDGWAVKLNSIGSNLKKKKKTQRLKHTI